MNPAFAFSAWNGEKQNYVWFDKKVKRRASICIQKNYVELSLIIRHMFHTDNVVPSKRNFPLSEFMSPRLTAIRFMLSYMSKEVERDLWAFYREMDKQVRKLRTPPNVTNSRLTKFCWHLHIKLYNLSNDWYTDLWETYATWSSVDIAVFTHTQWLINCRCLKSNQFHLLKLTPISIHINFIKMNTAHTSRQKNKIRKSII